MARQVAAPVKLRPAHHAFRVAVFILAAMAGCQPGRQSEPSQPVSPPPPPAVQESRASTEADRLIQALSSDDATVRQEAFDRLEQLGEEARGTLLNAARQEALDVRSSASLLLRILDVRAKLTPSLLSVFPRISRRLALGRPHLWTELFLDATTETNSIRKHPALERSDWEPLAGPALRAAEGEPEVVEVISRIHRFRLKGAASALIEKARTWTGSLDVCTHSLQVLGETGGELSADALTPFLESKEARIREEAARALGLLGLQEAKSRVVGLLRDVTDRVRGSALEALASMRATECAPEFLASLKDPSLYVRERAWRSIVQLRLEGLTDAIVGLLSDPSPETKFVAANALVGLRAKKAVPALVALLKHQDERVALVALEALTALKAREAAGAITSLMGASSPKIRAHVLIFLGETRSGGHEAAVIRHLDDKNREVRKAAVRAVGILQVREAIPQLISMMRDPEVSAVAGSLKDPRISTAVVGLLRESTPEHRPGLLRTLGTLGASEATGEIVRFLGDSDNDTRRAAVNALARIGAKEHLDEVKGLTRDERPGTRAAALDLLGKLGDASCVPETLRGLRDENRLVRAAAARALAALSAASADALQPLLSDADNFVRLSAAAALGRSRDPRAVPWLETLLKDPCVPVRHHAAQALCELGSVSGVACLLELSEMDEGPSVMIALNALKEPEAWRRLVSRPWQRQEWLDAEDAEVLLAKELGLSVQCQTDERALSSRSRSLKLFYDGNMLTSPSSRDFVEFTAGLYICDEWVIEGSVLRMISHKEALAYWRQWWQKQKPSGK